MQVGQSAVDAVVADGELFVVDAEQVQHRGVDVVPLAWGWRDLAVCSPIHRLAGGDTADTATTKPAGEYIRIVVTPLAPCVLGMRPPGSPVMMVSRVGRVA